MIKFKYMKLHKSILVLFVLSCLNMSIFAQNSGVFQTEKYLPMLQDQNLGLVVNHSSVFENQHLVDSLIRLDIVISKIFSPEHGFFGHFSAGEHVSDSMYNDTIPIVSLYGDNKKLKDHDLQNIDIIVFDIQDVGVRFYTYISTLHYVMEACARNNIKLLVFDRPNPHAHYIDGPVLSSDYTSFVGMHNVPVVYGMTIGEYALMINGEQWLFDKSQCDLEVIKIDGYSRANPVTYNLSAPSPNLKSMNAIFLYPSLCLFEGTSISVGRGTEFPFEIFGAPFLHEIKHDYRFEPKSNIGSKNPKYENEICYGISLSEGVYPPQFSIKYLIDTYNNTPVDHQDDFFNNYFNKLAGNSELKEQIINGISENQIRETWKQDLLKFQSIRKKYLLYD